MGYGRYAFVAGLLLGTAAWGLTIPVKFSPSARVRVTAIVDEVGDVLFGNTPGKVEVTNFPQLNTGGVVVFTVPGANACPVGYNPIYTGTLFVRQCIGATAS